MSSQPSLGDYAEAFEIKHNCQGDTLGELVDTTEPDIHGHLRTYKCATYGRETYAGFHASMPWLATDLGNAPGSTMCLFRYRNAP